MKNIKNLIFKTSKPYYSLTPVQDGEKFIINYTINEPEKILLLTYIKWLSVLFRVAAFLASQLFYIMLCSDLNKERLLCIDYDCNGNSAS